MKPQLPPVAAVFAFGMVFRVVKRPFFAPVPRRKMRFYTKYDENQVVRARLFPNEAIF
jgi:hypothetical protein